MFDLDGFIVTDAETLAEGLEDGVNEQRVRLNKYLTQEGQKMRYEYDFGDSWEHDIVLEKILLAEPDVSYPRCLKGKRACPPEDCGGIWGYAHLLEVLADEANPERQMYFDWLGGELDPEAFDLAEINEALQS